MGNNNSNKSGVNDEIERFCRIVHMEKQRLHHTFYPTSLEGSQEPNEDEGSTCGTTFCILKTRQSRQGYFDSDDWVDTFLAECEKLKEDCAWANVLPKILRSFKGMADMVFMREINWINFNSDLFMRSEDEIPILTRFSQSLNGEDLDYRCPAPKNSALNLEKMFRGTDIFHVDYLQENRVSTSQKLKGPITSMGFDVPKDIDLFESKSNRASQVLQSIIDYRNNTFIQNIASKEECDHSLMVRSLGHYKAITECIEKHLNNKNCSLGWICKYFYEHFEKQYSHLIAIRNKRQLVSEVQKAFSDLQQFIRVLQECINKFYCINRFKDHLKKLNLFTKENLINFLTSVMFSSNIYNTIFEAQSLIDEGVELKIMKNLDLLTNSSPEDFSVSEKFSLTQRTVAYIKGLHENYEYVNISPREGAEIDLSTVNNLVESTDIALCSQIKGRKSVRGSYQGRKPPKAQDNLLPIEKEPFWKAIKILRRIVKYKSPIHKIKCIYRSSEAILECIQQFYRENGISNFQEKIEGDDILGIFLYLCAKARIPSLATHCNFIQKFMTNKMSSSIAGYYCVTLSAAVMYLEEYDPMKNFTTK